MRWTLGFWLPLARVLFLDETDLLLFPPLRACWALQGAAPRQVLLTGRNARCVLFGAVDPLSGEVHLLARTAQRAEDFCAFLRHLRRRHPRGPLVLVLDSDASHTARASQRLADELLILLVFLPKRCPHLNPMDHLWRAAKGDVLANHQYASLDDELDRTASYLWSLSPQEVLTKAGILSPTFWIRRLRANLCKNFLGLT
ncbi:MULTISPECIES: IS630 family transposase [Myxococcaceae]|uniref:IS630 family transposase n=1 Tax=Myxococcaceae TaxID=31 RepID=UPI00129C11A4|nr:IS630 family transposase [Simulacricoccus sp. 17bor-14]